MPLFTGFYTSQVLSRISEPINKIETHVLKIMDLPTPSQRKMSQVATPLPSTRSRNCKGRRQHNTRQSEMQRSEAPLQPPFLHPETNKKT